MILSLWEVETKNFTGLIQNPHLSRDLKTLQDTTFHRQHVASNRKGRTMSKPAVCPQKRTLSNVWQYSLSVQLPLSARMVFSVARCACFLTLKTSLGEGWVVRLFFFPTPAAWLMQLKSSPQPWHLVSFWEASAC